MLSVIQPSTNLGTFPSVSYFPSDFNGYSQRNVSNPYNYYDKKWSFQQQEASAWPSASSYLFQYNNINDSSNEAHCSPMQRNCVSSCNSHSANYEGSYPVPTSRSRGVSHSRSQVCTKDYSKPLFVDCSIEYELPNAPKVPKNSEPILMIHPAYRAYKTAKRTLTKGVKSNLSSGTSDRKCVVPRVSIYCTPNTTWTMNASSRRNKRVYSQMSNSCISNTGSFIQHPYHFNYSSRSPYNCCYRYEQSSKRCCLSVPNNLDQFRQQQQQQQQNAPNVQTPFSLYIRRGGTFWT